MVDGQSYITLTMHVSIAQAQVGCLRVSICSICEQCATIGQIRVDIAAVTLIYMLGNATIS